MTTNDNARRMIYVILVVVASSAIAARIATVRSKTGEVPFLSANDRSRWCTISSLVDDGTYAIDRQISYREPKRNRRVWHTIDMVMHRGPDGKQHYYSSKPPLYPTMLAGVYAAFQGVTGAKIMDEPFLVARWMLVIVNLLPMIGYFALMIMLIERTGKTDFGRIFAAAAVTMGTLLVPFSISINNHLPAAICSAVALACVLSRRNGHWGMGLLAGIAGGFAAANELPALSMMCLWAALVLVFSGIRPAIGYVVGVAAVAIAFFLTNLNAHDSLRPPYAHRGVGPFIGDVAAEAPQRQPSIGEIHAALKLNQIDTSESLEVRDTTKLDVWEIWDEENQQRFALTPAGDANWQISQWDDWYDYPNTYWQRGGRAGVDKGEASRLTYLFHSLIGHHGILSLSPIWLLSIWGAVELMLRGTKQQRYLCFAICLATSVCFAFYMARPLVDRNYGGVSCGFRWMLWFIPLWIWLLIPAADRLTSLRVQIVALAMLAISVFSVISSFENPWQHPWLFRYWEYLGWIAY